MPATATDRLNGLTTSVAIKAPVKAVSTVNLTLSGLQTVGGIVLAENDRVLVKDQTDTTRNGIYTASTSDWVRAADFDGSRDAVQGTIVIAQFDNGQGRFFQITTTNPITIGTSNLVFQPFIDPDRIYDLIASEVSASLTPSDYSFTVVPQIDVLRYGIIPNIAAARSSNTSKLRALLDSTKTGPQGRLVFPPITGADTYYFDATPILVRDGISVDLSGCTLDVAGSATSSDVNSGFWFVQRDFTLENGTMNVAVNTSAASGSGYAVQVGARGTDSARLTLYDNLLAKPLGNIRLRNLRLNINNSGSNLAGTGAICLIGGVQNLEAENIRIDGSTTAGGGVVYEFGFATSASPPETSHANNLTFRNIRVEHLSTSIGIGLIVAGAYNVSVDGLHVKSAAGILSFTSGESLFYKPWVGFDEIGVKRNISLQNITGRTISGTAITLIGAQSASGGYLAATIAGLGHPGDYQAQTDLADYVLDGFAIDGTSNGFGINCSAGTADIRNGHVNGFERGIWGTDEWVRVGIENVKVFNCAKEGINLAGASAIWSPARKKTGYIRNCNVSANSTSLAGSFAGILIDNCASFLIEACRIGKESAFDGAAESTQGNGVQLGTGAANVICRADYVGGVFAGSYAYYNASSTAANGCTVENASGVTTTNNSAWLHQLKGPSASRGDTNQTLTAGTDFETQRWATALTANRTVTLSTTNAKAGDRFRVVRTGLGAFTLDVGGLRTIPNSTAAFVDVAYDGSTWLLTAYGTL